FFFFFFQAEDGIRDRTVTGVQTCALPIFRRVKQRFASLSAVLVLVVASLLSACATSGDSMSSDSDSQAATSSTPVPGEKMSDDRSEERRVGKECRSRRGGEQWNREVERVQ